jgi:hypothetical protein
MKTFLLAGMIAFAAPAYAVELPDAMMGSWTMGDEEGIMDRAGKDTGDFLVEKEHYYAVDTACDILHIEKIGNSYIVQANCHFDDSGGPDSSYQPHTETSEFEMKGDRLRVTPATGS